MIPLAGLVAMLGLILLANRELPPLAAEFGGPPEVRDLPSPALGLGDQVLQGTVFAADGRPAEGASLFAVQRGRPVWTFTGSGGGFVLSDLVAGPLEVAVHAPGHLATLFPTQVGVGPVVLRLTETIPSPPDLPDPTRVELVGQVFAPRVDLSGFEVALLPTAPATEPGTGVPRRTSCDAEGRFRIDAVTPSEYEVLLLPPWARGGSWPDLLTGLHGPALRVIHPPVGELQLALAAGSIVGRAFDKTRGEPLAGALVVALPLPDSLDSTDPRRFPPTRTGPSGAYRLEQLPPGRYRVILTAGEDVRETELEVVRGGVSDPGF